MLNFVDTQIPEESANTHFCFLGATGSGKTVCIRLLMQSALPVFREGKIIGVQRALVYDAKRDMLPVLHGIVGRDDYEHGHRHKVITLNPFDARSYAWDISRDITAPSQAQEIATILIPKESSSSQPFFANSARLLLQGVMTVFIRAKKRWTLRDVVLAFKDMDRLIGILRSSKYTEHLVDSLLLHPETSKNILSEVASRIGPYEVIAALWHRAETKGRIFSLDEWLNGEDRHVLVLGCEHTNRAAIDAINQVIFKRISEMILDQDDDDERRTWVFLDEFVRAGRLDGIVELATEGRSKGVAVVLGFQDINGARAVYGREVAEEIVGQCSNIAILRLQSPDTAEWASRLFGKYEREELKITEQSGYSGRQSSGSTSWTTDRVQREAVLASEFMYLPPTNRENGLHCFRYVPDIGRIDLPIEGEKLFGDGSQKEGWSGGLLWPKLKREAGFERRADEEQYLEDWDIDDFERLGLFDLMEGEGFLVNALEIDEKWERIEKLAKRAFYLGDIESQDEFLRKEISTLLDHEKVLYGRFLELFQRRYPLKEGVIISQESIEEDDDDSLPDLAIIRYLGQE